VTDPKTILVVDDEAPIRRALEVLLNGAGYRVLTAAYGGEALEIAAASPPDLVILDLVLPDRTGIEVCRQLREWSVAPVLLVSVVGEEPDKVRALDAGADDYLTKPFGVDELLARVRALLRRGARSATDAPVIEQGVLTLDLGRRVATGPDGEIPLTPIEYALLRELVRAGGRPLTHTMLLRSAWENQTPPESQVLRVHVARLRDKLAAHGISRDLIETVTGVGYRIRDDEA
jgi:two-component system, OmpR family, KDP operon response regulator KdpE